MRPQFITTTFADTTTKVQITAESRIFAVSIKARDGNAEAVYFNTSSAVVSSAGYELTAGQEWSASYEELGGSIKRDTFWAIAADSGDQIDWAFTVQD